MTTATAKSKKTAVSEAAAAPEVVTSYKGFDKDWKCRGFQYKVGETFEHKGKVAACEGGFHACEYPLHVLRYYKPSQSVFAVVEQSGTLARHEEDSKIASSRLTITAQIDLAGLIKAAIKYTMDRCTPAEGASSAQSSPMPSAARRTSRVKYLPIRSNSPRDIPRLSPRGVRRPGRPRARYSRARQQSARPSSRTPASDALPPCAR